MATSRNLAGMAGKHTGTSSLRPCGHKEKAAPWTGATIQRGRKAGSQGRLCKVSLWQAERPFGSCRELCVVVKVMLLCEASFVVQKLSTCGTKGFCHTTL